MAKLKYKRYYLTLEGFDKLAKRGGWWQPCTSHAKSVLFPVGKKRVLLTQALLALIAKRDWDYRMELSLPAPSGPGYLHDWLYDKYETHNWWQCGYQHPETYARRILPHVLRALEQLKAEEKRG